MFLLLGTGVTEAVTVRAAVESGERQSAVLFSIVRGCLVLDE